MKKPAQVSTATADEPFGIAAANQIVIVQIESNLGGIFRWDNVPPMRTAAPAPVAPSPPSAQAPSNSPQPATDMPASDAGTKYLLYYVNGLPVLLAVKSMPMP